MKFENAIVAARVSQLQIKAYRLDAAAKQTSSEEQRHRKKQKSMRLGQASRRPSAFVDKRIAGDVGRVRMGRQSTLADLPESMSRVVKCLPQQ
jgi:hypothetical protein